MARDENEGRGRQLQTRVAAVFPRIDEAETQGNWLLLAVGYHYLVVLLGYVMEVGILQFCWRLNEQFKWKFRYAGI